uniref:Uncharacterized protein n=1 Tax=Hyaloperonospora arabidopsidis (strain Emoy2) TaxID=559515 RepID=M4C074_HYAAE
MKRRRYRWPLAHGDNKDLVDLNWENKVKMDHQDATNCYIFSLRTEKTFESIFRQRKRISTIFLLYQKASETSPDRTISHVQTGMNVSGFSDKSSN